MNFKKNWKRFWTLSSAREGFTLVELIVVIAILAILAGVAVPAYSGYVTKANKQADITLISEIEHALTLAYYNQDLVEGESGYVVLMPNVPVTDDVATPNIVTPLEKVFGSNWKDIMQLKYDGWGVSWNTVNYEDASTVVNSNFVQNYSPDELMSQVQAMTSAVQNLNVSMGNALTSIYDLYTYEDGENVIDKVITEYYGDSKTWESLNETEKSNLLVLATAYSINDTENATAAELVVSDLAKYTAYASVNEEFNEDYEEFLANISGVNDKDALVAEFNALKSSATSNGFDTWDQGSNVDAFTAIMAGVGNAMDENGDAILAQLNDPNIFTSGIGYDMYNDYLGAAYAIAYDPYGGMLTGMIGMLDEDYAGGVIVWYSVVNGELHIGNSLPNV